MPPETILHRPHRRLRVASRILPAWLIFAGCLVCSAAEPATLAPASSNSIANARAHLQKEILPKVPGCSIAVALDGKLIWSEAFGFSNLEAKFPTTRATRFRIGSISKSLTAVGLMLLVERGQIELDAPVQKYLPQFPIKDAPITPRMLGGHLSGIRHYRGQEMLLNRRFDTVPAGLVLFQNEPLEAPPGSKYIYTTYGYTLLSAVMEVSAGQDFLRFMDQNVIQPLGMTRTGPDLPEARNDNCTRFYLTDGQGEFVVAPEVDCSYKWAGGGYLSTPEDLVRFGSALLAPGFLKSASLDLLFTPQKTADGKPTTYGIGWNVYQDAGGLRVYMHTGGSVGGTSFLILHPDNKVVVAFTCNHSKAPFVKKDAELIAELFSAQFANPPGS